MTQVSFSMEFESGNAAFSEAPEDEAARIVEAAAILIRAGRDGGACHDLNGNKVGYWGLSVERETCDECDTELDAYGDCPKCAEEEPEPENLCACGSGKERFELRDARGISCGYVCEDCIEEKKAGYRPEIFTDSGYEASEPIEPEE